MEIKILNLKFGIISILFLFFLSLFGLSSYQGSAFYYFTFDIAWLAVLLCAFCFSQSYVIFYVQIMLFLGFWTKLMTHLILKVSFIEPTGYWTYNFASPAAWDQVLLISSLAAGGILLANLLFFYSTKKTPRKNITLNVPQWYIKHSDFIWHALIFVGLATSIINFFCHISTTGLRPQIILPFHLNAVIIWLMVIAIPLSMATFLGWEQDPNQKRQRFYYICFMAFITSLSVFSRAIYLFWTLPYILILFSNFNFSFKKLASWRNTNVIIAYLTFIILSIVLVNVIRINNFSKLALEENATGRSLVAVEHKSSPATNKEKFTQLPKLFAGRWVGLEGVMATTAFPQSGWLFFKESIIKKPAAGDIGVYTHKVLEPYQYKNTKKTMFSSLPGLVAILNYSSSKPLVFLGMFGVCFLLCYLEQIVFLMMRNKFLLSQQGLILGYWCVAGLNIPYLGLINLLECFFVSLCLYLISPCYSRIIKYFNKNNLSLSSAI